MTRTIPLANGRGVALVDEADYAELAQYRWRLNRGYAVRDGRSAAGQRIMVRMHRELMAAAPGMEIDHIDGNRLDNTRANLRFCNHRENLRNCRPHRGGTSKYKGIYLERARRQWRAQIRVDGRRICLGRFADEQAAARAYDIAAQRYFGAFARMNFGRCA